ncbi:hypothetical protein AOLI_G00296210 [Acnodon oligacanthus]
MNSSPKKKQTLTVLSWNVNGFTQKKSSIFNHLNHLQADVVFLQETHIGPNANSPAGSIQIQSLEHDYDWAVYTVFKRNCRGVAIMFRKGLVCEGLRVVGDEKGRYMIISCRIQEQEFMFANVYNPTDEKIDFNKFREFLIPASESTYFIFGGDFNTVMDAEFDKTSSSRNRGHSDRFKGLVSLLDTFSLVDVWRWLYPEKKNFTYFDGKGKSRLDYFFIPVRILKRVTACQIYGRPQYSEREGCISDHAPISVQIQTGHRWQFCSGLFKDEDTMEQLSNIIRNISGGKHIKKEDLWPALKVRVTCETLALNKSGDNFKSPRHSPGIQMSQVPKKQPMEKEYLLSSANHVHLLHSPDNLSDASSLEGYLDYLHETKMFEDIKLILNATLTEPVSKKEILTAILSLRNSEHITPDGLPVTFYKHFASKITGLLQVFFNQVLDQQSIFKCIFNESFISDTFSMTTLNFNNTDHTYSSNVQHYSPVFIFNVDYNILALILAERLNSVMGYMLNQGKIRPHLSAQDCINAFVKIRADQLPVLAVSVKVDPGGVKWPYLFHRLKTLNLPDRFRSMVRSLVLEEGRTSDPPARGLKVGCPLTPLLISICLLPLIHSINEETRLQGVRIRGEYVKSVLDKDRAIIFLSNTNEGLNVFEALLKDFLKNSGFVIDGRFSEVFITGHSCFNFKKEILQSFKRTLKGFWYKGILVGSEDPGLVQIARHQGQCNTVMT